MIIKAANNNNTCPICNKIAEEKYHPFCSKRCSDIDLGRWFNESYTIPVEETVKSTSDDDDFNQ